MYIHILFNLCTPYVKNKDYHLIHSDAISILNCAFESPCFFTHGFRLICCLFLFVLGGIDVSKTSSKHYLASLQHHLNIIYTSSKDHPNIIQTSSKHHPNIIQISFKYHPSIIQISFKHHPSSIQTSSEHHPNTSPQSHQNITKTSPLIFI